MIFYNFGETLSDKVKVFILLMAEMDMAQIAGLAKEQTLEDFLSKGEFPFDYEKSLYADKKFLDNILRGDIMPPLHFEFLPTDRCNNNCIWCRGGHRKFMVTDNELDEKVMVRVIEELADYRVKGIVRFSGMTGEPLMNGGTLKAVRKGTSLGLNIGIITNGILLGHEARDSLTDTAYVSVSLDAGTSETFNRLKGHTNNVFEDILDSMRQFAELRQKRRSRTRFGAGFMIHPGNYFEAATAARRVKETGADMIQFKVPYFLGVAAFTQEQLSDVLISLEKAREYSDGNFKVFFMQRRDEQERELTGVLPKPDFKKCYAQFINGVIVANGDVYPCVHFGYNHGISGSPMGNVYFQGLRDIWEGEKREEVIERICPSSECSICNRYDNRINRFVNFIASNDISCQSTLSENQDYLK